MDRTAMDERGGRRPTEVALLALLHAVAGVLCLVGAVWPPSADTPVRLTALLGVVGLTAAAVIWAAGTRRPAATHAGLALVSGGVALLAWRSATAVGVVGLGPVLVTIGLYAAHFFPLPVARLHAGLAVLLATAGAVAAAPGGFALHWTLAVLSTGVLTEVQGRLSAQLHAAAATDPLTGLANRRAWEAEASRMLARAHRGGDALTIALIDLDGFKQVNDRHGHGAGDDLLRAFTAHCTERLRTSDLIGRWGGDEFVVCLTATDDRGVGEVLDRLSDGAPAPWSVGTATAGEGDSLTSLLARADAALYLDKGRRRDR